MTWAIIGLTEARNGVELLVRVCPSAEPAAGPDSLPHCGTPGLPGHGRGDHETLTYGLAPSVGGPGPADRRDREAHYLGALADAAAMMAARNAAGAGVDVPEAAAAAAIARATG